MKYLQVAFALILSISLVAGQYFAPQYSNFGGQNSFGLHSLSPDFNSPGAYSGSIYQQSVRDARQDRGPVVFPQPPADAPEESSGVIIGASGYGFVPPNSPQYRSQQRQQQTSVLPTDHSSVFDEENEIRTTFDSFGTSKSTFEPTKTKFGSSRTTFGPRLIRYNRYYPRKFPFF